MLTVYDILSARKKLPKRQDDASLRNLPFRQAFIYGRLSSPGQVRDSHESVREISKLILLAQQDGYQTGLNAGEIEEKLLSLQREPSGKMVWTDGGVTVDVRDLGLSGQLSADERQGLANLQKQVSEGIVGAVYVTEGVSRLSRDRDRILPYQLLKLLKERQCRIRTPEGVWNPAIERDWDYLAEEFEDAIGELKVMRRRMYQRKVQKAGRGEFVGEPIPPGFILPIAGRKPNGEYQYSKMEPYPPHAEVVTRVLEELVRQNGSLLKTAQALKDVTIPFFPPDLEYMERLSSLRHCHRQATGYKISTSLIYGLATNVKLIGVWQWGDGEVIVDNHKPVVPEGLFLEAYRLAVKKDKPKGRAVRFAPLEWTGLLWCMNHEEPRHISSHSADKRYSCNRDYSLGAGPICLDISGRFLDEPLTATVLKELDFTPYAEELLDKLQSQAINGKLEQLRYKQHIANLEQQVKKWEALLPCCVNSETGEVDREREGFYWSQIKEAKSRLAELAARPPCVEARTAVDFTKVRDLLNGLSRNWNSYSLGWRNRLLKLLIERVELRGTYDLEAVIVWKTGFKQKVYIHRPLAGGRRERRWTDAEDRLLRMLYPASSQEAVVAALPGRNWKAISLRAFRLQLSRKKGCLQSQEWRRWTDADDGKLSRLYESGMPLNEIADHLQRTTGSVLARVAKEGLAKPAFARRREAQVVWNSVDLVPLQEASSRGGLRG